MADKPKPAQKAKPAQQKGQQNKPAQQKPAQKPAAQPKKKEEKGGGGKGGKKKDDGGSGGKNTQRRDLLLSIQEEAQNKWKTLKAFDVDAPKQGEPQKPKFFGNFPYPYMNGLLHLGHDWKSFAQRLPRGAGGSAAHLGHRARGSVADPLPQWEGLAAPL